MVITAITRDSNLAQTSIQEGDILIAIGDAPVWVSTTVDEAQERLRGEIGSEVILTVRDRYGRTTHYPALRSASLVQALGRLGFSLDAYIRYILSFSLIQALGFWLIGLLIFWRRSDEPIGLLVSAALVAFGATDAAIYAQSWKQPFGALQAIAEALCLFVFYLFPDGNFFPRWLRSLGLLGILWITAVHVFHPYMPPIHVLVTAAIWSGGLISQAYRYRHQSSPTLRQQTKWVIWGFSIAFVIYFLYACLDVASGGWRYYYLISLYPLRRIGLLAAPLAFGIATLRYKLWDIDLVINRSLVYGALTVLLGGLFLGSLAAISRVFQALSSGQQSVIAIAATALIFGLLFQPSRRLLQRFIDQRFYGIQIDYHKKATPPSPSVAGDTVLRLSSYTELELIGRGGMSKVYKARHPTLDRAVAIKVLAEHLVQEADFRKRFEREAQTVALLKHPNIVQVFDFGEAGGMYYMVMEYIAGPDLGTWINERGRLPLTQALPLIRQIASALDYAHAQGLVHRDIKPSNIMLDPVTAVRSGDIGYRAVLMDFGLAKIVGGSAHLTQAGVIGTFGYIAPEQIRAAADVDHRADVYSFGVVVYQMLTGQLPFKQQHPSALLLAHLTQPPPDPRQSAPDLPKSVAEVLNHALAKDPADRYPSAGAFALALES